MAAERWASRGGANRLHLIAADLPGGRARFACGREGIPEDPPGRHRPWRCPGCEEQLGRIQIAERRRAEPADPRRARAAASI